MNSYHYLLKFIVIGDTGVGKSCVVLQFVENKTRSAHDVTIGVEFGAKTIKVSNQNIKLQIWDTAGQQNFKSITRSYYRSAIGALLVYDITRRQTFEHAKQWLDQVRQNGNPHIQILLVGNKNDLQQGRRVSLQQGKQFAKLNQINFIEINSKDNKKVTQAFQEVSQSILKKIENKIIPLNVQNIGIKSGDFLKMDLQLQNERGKKKKGCC